MRLEAVQSVWHLSIFRASLALICTAMLADRLHADHVWFFDNNLGTGNGQWETATNWQHMFDGGGFERTLPEVEAWIANGQTVELSSSQALFKLFAGQDERTSSVVIKSGGRLETYQEAVVGGGHGGTGSMTIQSGALGWKVRAQARVGGSDNNIGYAHGTLVVNGGTNEFPQELNVGMDGGEGTATINGGTIAAERIYVGRAILLNNGPDARHSIGEFTINAGGSVTAKSFVAAGISGSPDGTTPGGNGTLNINRGTLNIIGSEDPLLGSPGNLRIGVMNRAVGQLNVTGGSINVANDVIIGQETGQGVGVFSGNLDITGNFYIGTGYGANPSSPFDTINASGSFTVNSGAIDLAGTLGVGSGAESTSTAIGLLTINGGNLTGEGPLLLGDDFGSKGTIKLNGGNLKVADATINQLIPQQNQLIIDAGGTFAMPDSKATLMSSLIAAGNIVAAAGKTLGTPVVSGGLVTVSVASAALLGDYNSNGIVDAADYTVWRNKSGTNTPVPNDGGLGTPIGPAHYTLWKQNFNPSGGAGSSHALSVQAVPEPGTLLLSFIGSVFVLLKAARRVSGDIK